MQNEHTPDTNDGEGQDYKWFAVKRVAAGVLIAALVIWMGSVIFGFFENKPDTRTTRVATAQDTGKAGPAAHGVKPAGESSPQPAARAEAPASGEKKAVDRYKKLFDRHISPQAKQTAESHAAQTAQGPEGHATAVASDHGSDEPLPRQPAAPAGTEPHPLPAPAREKTQAAEASHDAAAGHGVETVASAPKARGVAFVEAMIAPLDYELNQRFWGWRPNDILDFTDNVNNFQLGVLEVTRRTTIVLTERISRIGSAASFDKNMEQAMNWFMIKASTYWLPSPEDKYNEGLANLREYARGLENGTARFYTRTDNLIPLLAVYEDLLGSCDENLVKTYGDDGEKVSSFKADDYFYYAQGVASALMGILQAVQIDFDAVLETRKARDALQHAVESLHHAVEIAPWLILNSDLSSLFANHRANMAAPISHARFYLGVAIGALST